MEIVFVDSYDNFLYNKGLLKKAREDKDFRKEFLIANTAKLHILISKISEVVENTEPDIEKMQSNLVNKDVYNELYVKLLSFFNFLESYIEIVDEFISMLSKHLDEISEEFENLNYKNVLNVQNNFQHNKKVAIDIIKDVKELGYI